jgi:hypothetical protein
VETALSTAKVSTLETAAAVFVSERQKYGQGRLLDNTSIMSCTDSYEAFEQCVLGFYYDVGFRTQCQGGFY